MAGGEREKWNAIYGEHDRAPGTPARVLTDYAHLLPAGGRALDLACGTGQNALFLAARGLDTCAWDISAVALQQLKERAQQLGLQVHVEERDAVARPPEPDSFDVIVVCRFLDRSLAPQLNAALRIGGLLCYQTFTREAGADAGPRNPLYRLGPNELLKLFACLHVIAYHEEGTVGDARAGFRDEALLVAQRRAD